MLPPSSSSQHYTSQPPPNSLLVPDQPPRPSNALATNTSQPMTTRYLRDGNSLNIGNHSISSTSSPAMSEFANDFTNILPFQGSDTVMFDVPRIQQYQDIPSTQVPPGQSSLSTNHQQVPQAHFFQIQNQGLQPMQQGPQQLQYQIHPPPPTQHQYPQQQPFSFPNFQPTLHPHQHQHPPFTPTLNPAVQQLIQQQQQQHQQHHQQQQEGGKAQVQAFMQQQAQQPQAQQAQPLQIQADPRQLGQGAPTEQGPARSASGQSHQQQHLPSPSYPQHQLQHQGTALQTTTGIPVPSIKSNDRRPFVHDDIVMVPYVDPITKAKSWWALEDFIQRQVEDRLATAVATVGSPAEVLTLRGDLSKSRTECEELATTVSALKGQTKDLRQDHQLALNNVERLENLLAAASKDIGDKLGTISELKAKLDRSESAMVTSRADAKGVENDLLKEELTLAREELNQVKADLDDARCPWQAIGRGEEGSQEEEGADTVKTRIRSLESTIDTLQAEKDTLKRQVDKFESENEQRRVKELHIQNARELTKLHVQHTGDYTDLRTPPPPSSPIGDISRSDSVGVGVRSGERESEDCDCGRAAVIEEMTIRSEKVFVETLRLVTRARGAVEDNLESSPLKERRVRSKPLQTVRRYQEIIEALVAHARAAAG